MSKIDTTASKRIAVTDETWKKLHEMRKPGQTFGQLINLMILLVEAGEGDFISLEEARKQLGLDKND